jgi:hypothetical protein
MPLRLLLENDVRNKAYLEAHEKKCEIVFHEANVEAILMFAFLEVDEQTCADDGY